MKLQINSTLQRASILVHRFVRHISAWAWKPIVWDRATIYELHYRHVDRTYGGDVERTRCMSIWTSLEEAKEAERRAWKEYGWKKLEPKKDGTTTWIEKRTINSLPNVRDDLPVTDGVTSASERSEPAPRHDSGGGLGPSHCSRFFDIPLVKWFRRHIYGDALREVGQETITRLLDAGYVVVPWAEHADMFLDWKQCPPDVREEHRTSMESASISSGNLAAQMRQHMESSPKYASLCADQKPSEMQQNENQTSPGPSPENPDGTDLHQATQ